MRVRNQKDAVLNYIEKHGSITAKDASDELGVTRLAARVSEINDILLAQPRCVRDYGWGQFEGKYLVADYEYVRNRYGQKVRIARYRFDVVYRYEA